ncbi:TetR family transcriptional regulator [Virgibacillus dakarensis]|uniref:TetR family transcriptional regulator n=1 Tax=Lentibacillus populi TaxID=1827502 RepID=A0A9W5TVR1_9BACI|nr:MULTISPECIES: TetR/AcrR family transcriptional regulator [Bacillaceae]MBT2215279.1 TetR/AcrR family transcriptional regulator [Virgibacillus dakarensis]MTW86082.1 TetR family transcriptional regulator [Virgibacillus dakarensis]GGB34904.1 TetR family transcriptional regulator [Lentibacillus populi]
MTDKQILSSVKDQELIEKRRTQMVQGAITLFKEKGFHRTTTREIAKEAGFSIGTLYEYIRTKEDILFLVVDSIHHQVRDQLEAKINLATPSVANFVSVIQSYFHLMDDMQEEVLILYQEVKSLKKESREYVLRKERDMISMLERVIAACLPDEIAKQDVELLANNIFVQGQMWGFRRWILQKQFTLEEYIDGQINYLLKGLNIKAQPDEGFTQKGGV